MQRAHEVIAKLPSKGVTIPLTNILTEFGFKHMYTEKIAAIRMITETNSLFKKNTDYRIFKKDDSLESEVYLSKFGVKLLARKYNMMRTPMIHAFVKEFTNLERKCECGCESEFEKEPKKVDFLAAMPTQIHTAQYNGQPIRFLIHGGEPWFVGLDICKVVGYVHTSDAMAKLLSTEKKLLDVPDALGRLRKTYTITKVGLHVLCNSRPNGQALYTWITATLLPSFLNSGAIPSHLDEADIKVLRDASNSFDLKPFINTPVTYLVSLIINNKKYLKIDHTDEIFHTCMALQNKYKTEPFIINVRHIEPALEAAMHSKYSELYIKDMGIYQFDQRIIDEFADFKVRKEPVPDCIRGLELEIELTKTQFRNNKLKFEMMKWNKLVGNTYCP